ncbi:MAG: HAMP domain-containing histidine kinase [Calothrix sp. FI2-JRJ7]|nr:HAMP domain-containing histidine kinase [Calothrix sp. FI2-JRJ7]
MSRFNRLFPKIDSFSLQFRLTIGVIIVSAFGLAGLASWTGWKMQRILIDSHKRNIQEIASRLPRDVEVYSEMLPIETALQKAIDNRTENDTLLWVKSQDTNQILAKSNNFNPVSGSNIAELISLTQMPDKAEIYAVKGHYFVLCGEKLRIKGELIGEIYIAQDITRDQTMFVTLLHNVGIAGIVVIVIISATIAFYIKNSLQPLRQISQMTAVIQAEDLDSYKLHLAQAPTEVKELAQTVNMMLSRLSQAWEKERQFTSNISHELRTPLTVVYGYLQSVLRRQQNLTEIQKEALQTAASEAERTIHILQDLLDLVRIDSRYGHFDIKPCTLNDIVSDLVEMAYQNSNRQIKIEAPTHPIIVKADSNKLEKVLLNLIDNAIKYSHQDTPIVIKLKQIKNEGIIEVFDNGYGIPLQHQSRIFERFYRVDDARSSNGGTGLGLSIVKSFIESMGGTVMVSSKINQGSVFTIILPC